MCIQNILRSEQHNKFTTNLKYTIELQFFISMPKNSVIQSLTGQLDQCDVQYKMHARISSDLYDWCASST